MTIVGVDVDGVVADLHTEWLRLYNSDYNDDLTRGEVVTWNTHKYVKPECGKKIYAYLGRADLYDKVEPVVGALDGVNNLRRAGYSPIFVTSNVKGMTDPKWRWLEHHGFMKSQSELVVMHDKSLLNASALIDDGLHNVEAFRGGKAILFNAPWNAGGPWPGPRAFGWQDVLSFFINGVR